MKKFNNKIKRKVRNRKKLKDVGLNKLRISVTKSLNNLSAQIIDDKAKKVISDFNSRLVSVDKLNKETLEPLVNELVKSNNTNFKGVGQPLRIALTGSKFGPGIYDIIVSLGKEEVRKRLTNKKFS